MNRYNVIFIYRDGKDIIKKTLIVKSESPQAAMESIIDRSFRQNVRYRSPLFREYTNGCVMAVEESPR